MLNSSNLLESQQFEEVVKKLSELKFTSFWGGSDVVKTIIKDVERQIASKGIFYTEAELEEKRLY